jgi:hypothetical protein
VLMKAWLQSNHPSVFSRNTSFAKVFLKALAKRLRR